MVALKKKHCSFNFYLTLVHFKVSVKDMSCSGGQAAGWGPSVLGLFPQGDKYLKITEKDIK